MLKQSVLAAIIFTVFDYHTIYYSMVVKNL